MTLLIDTHILMWWVFDDHRLSSTARRLVEDPGNRIVVSVISLWEVAIKNGKGKLEVDPAELMAAIDTMGFPVLPVEPRHVSTYMQLPAYHADPFDRMLIAQALTEPSRLLTHDTALVRYSELVTLV